MIDPHRARRPRDCGMRSSLRATYMLHLLALIDVQWRSMSSINVYMQVFYISTLITLPGSSPVGGANNLPPSTSKNTGGRGFLRFGPEGLIRSNTVVYCLACRGNAWPFSASYLLQKQDGVLTGHATISRRQARVRPVKRPRIQGCARIHVHRPRHSTELFAVKIIPQVHAGHAIRERRAQAGAFHRRAITPHLSG